MTYAIILPALKSSFRNEMTNGSPVVKVLGNLCARPTGSLRISSCLAYSACSEPGTAKPARESFPGQSYSDRFFQALGPRLIWHLPRWISSWPALVQIQSQTRSTWNLVLFHLSSFCLSKISHIQRGNIDMVMRFLICRRLTSFCRECKERETHPSCSYPFFKFAFWFDGTPSGDQFHQ